MTKILIYRLSSIGDIVLTTPVIRCLRIQFPNAEIHYITRKRFAEILENNPYIDKLILVQKSPLEALKRLRAEKYDFIIDLHCNIRSLYLRFQLLNSHSSSFPKLNIRKWLLVQFKWNTLPKIHIVDRYFIALRKFKTKNDQLGLDWFFSDSEIAHPSVPNSKFIAIAISGNYYTKRYPSEYILSVVNQLNIPVVLLGGKDEEKEGEWICKRTNMPVINLCGKLSLMQSAWVINQSSVCVANDTGLMHIAAALKKPLISVWGNTVPAFGMYPYYPAEMQNLFSIIENKDIKCRPCSKLGFEKCPKKHFNCMNQISSERIINAITQLMA